MPENPISATVVICDRILQEKSDTYTLIRLVDLFKIRPIKGVPIEDQGVTVRAFVNVKTTAEDDAEHDFKLKVVRPDGASGYINEGIKAQLTTTVKGTPRGLGIAVEISVVPRFEGTYFLVVEMDQSEVAWTAFTLDIQPVAGDQG